MFSRYCYKVRFKFRKIMKMKTIEVMVELELPEYILDQYDVVDYRAPKEGDTYYDTQENTVIYIEDGGGMTEPFPILEKKRWRAEIDMDYFFINDDGIIKKDSDMDLPLDNRRFKLGNYFKTKEEAEEKLEALRKVFK